MLQDQLNRAGYAVGRRNLGTLMKRMGIEALYRKPGTGKKHPGHKVYPYLLRGVTIDRSNQVWALDTTYIPMAKGFIYLTAVVDYASRKRYWWPSSPSPWRPAMPSMFCRRRLLTMARP